jgi:hypothetical protein
MRGFLNIGSKTAPDMGPDFIAGPDIPSGPDFSSLYHALPFDTSPANVIDHDISTVDPLAGISSPGQPVIPTQDVWNDLDTLRLKMPWLPIQLFPPLIRTAFMAAANTAQDIDVPTGAAIVQFYGPGDFFVSIGGRAVVPIVAGDRESASLYKPSGAFYIGGAKQISVVSAAVNAIVQAAFWTK